MNEYIWLVKSSKGDFLISVVGNWTQEEAEEKLRTVLAGLGIDITKLITRKRATGDPESGATIVQDLEPQTEVGFSLYAGRKLWVAAGKGSEFDAELTRTDKEMKDALEEAE